MRSAGSADLNVCVSVCVCEQESLKAGGLARESHKASPDSGSNCPKISPADNTGG